MDQPCPIGHVGPNIGPSELSSWGFSRPCKALRMNPCFAAFHRRGPCFWLGDGPGWSRMVQGFRQIRWGGKRPSSLVRRDWPKLQLLKPCKSQKLPSNIFKSLAGFVVSTHFFITAARLKPVCFIKSRLSWLTDASRIIRPLEPLERLQSRAR